jgi:hypothetical protein
MKVRVCNRHTLCIKALRGGLRWVVHSEKRQQLSRCHKQMMRCYPPAKQRQIGRGVRVGMCMACVVRERYATMWLSRSPNLREVETIVRVWWRRRWRQHLADGFHHGDGSCAAQLRAARGLSVKRQ